MSHNNIITTSAAYALLCFSLSHSLSLLFPMYMLTWLQVCYAAQCINEHTHKYTYTIAYNIVPHVLLSILFESILHSTSPSPAFHLLEYLSSWHVLLVLEFTKMPRGGNVRPGGGTFCVTSIALAALPLRLLGCNNLLRVSSKFPRLSDSGSAQPRSINFMLH